LKCITYLLIKYTQKKKKVDKKLLANNLMYIYIQVLRENLYWKQYCFDDNVVTVMFFNFLYHHHYQIDVNVNGNDYVNDGDVGNDFSSSFLKKIFSNTINNQSLLSSNNDILIPKRIKLSSYVI
jgi:hypothetical protein